MGITWKRRMAGAVAVPLLLLVACGDDDDTVSSDQSVDVDSGTTDDPGDDDPADDDAADDGENDDRGDGGASAEPLADDDLPGEAFDLFPYAGDEMAVVGVEADDTLNLRAGPGPGFDVVTTLAPLSDGEAVATGRNRRVETGTWAELSVGSVTGWANTAFLLQSAVAVDDTTRLYPNVDDRPFVAAEDDPPAAMTELGLLVAAEYESTDGPTSTLTVVDGPHLGEMSDVTIDVVGLGDDSVGGYRVHVFSDADHEGYGVHRVETTALCSRGVSDDLCL